MKKKLAIVIFLVLLVACIASVFAINSCNTATKKAGPIHAPTNNETKDDQQQEQKKQFDPEKCIHICQRLTNGDYYYTEDGWDDAVKEAGEYGLTLDDSCKGAFDYYTHEGNYNLAFTSFNKDENYEKVNDTTYKITTTVLRAPVTTMRGQSPKEAQNNGMKNIENDDNQDQYETTVQFTLTVDGDTAKLVCDTPNWYKE